MSNQQRVPAWVEREKKNSESWPFYSQDVVVKYLKTVERWYCDGMSRVCATEVVPHLINLNVSLVLFRTGEPDCQVGSMYMNWYCRPRNGMLGRYYTTEKAMRKAIEAALKKQGVEMVRWEDHQEARLKFYPYPVTEDEYRSKKGEESNV